MLLQLLFPYEAINHKIEFASSLKQTATMCIRTLYVYACVVSKLVAKVSNRQPHFGAVLLTNDSYNTKQPSCMLLNFFVVRLKNDNWSSTTLHQRLGPLFETGKQQKLFNQSYKVQITPLVIYGYGGGHTNIYTNTQILTYVPMYA